MKTRTEGGKVAGGFGCGRHTASPADGGLSPLTVGVLYESSEWSDFKLAAELAERGLSVRMVDCATTAPAEAVAAAGSCDALVSRIFASAVFRGHGRAHETMVSVIKAAGECGIPLINPARAHFFEIDKARAVVALAAAGVDVPHVQAVGMPCALEAATLSYPCIIKPNCGGRTTYTALTRSEAHARAFLDGLPAFEFVVEDYIVPERGFITRVELVDGRIALVVKRSVVAGGLSAYHLGSTYELYPDCPFAVCDAALRAGRALSIEFGSFDIIEHDGRAYVIDANSVSNVSPDNAATFGGFDLMAAYADAIALRLAASGK